MYCLFGSYNGICFNLKEPLTENDIVKGIKVEDGRVVTYKNKNIGILTGEISNVVVIDIDSEKALNQLKALGELPKTWATKSGRGWHLYYNYVPLPSCTPMKEVDFLSDRKQVVAPPSIHPNGYQYHWLISPNEIERADLPKWFINLINSTKQVSTNLKSNKSSAKKTIQPLYPKPYKNESIESILINVDWINFYSRFVSNITGSGEWISSTCPFHEDAHNSFGFNIQNGGWRCFAKCGSGNGIQAIQQLYHVSFKDAIQLLKGENIYV